MCKRGRVNLTEAVERWSCGVLLLHRARRLRDDSTPVGFLGIEQSAPARWLGPSSIFAYCRGAAIPRYDETELTIAYTAAATVIGGRHACLYDGPFRSAVALRWLRSCRADRLTTAPRTRRSGTLVTRASDLSSNRLGRSLALARELPERLAQSHPQPGRHTCLRAMCHTAAAGLPVPQDGCPHRTFFDGALYFSLGPGQPPSCFGTSKGAVL